MQLVRNVAVSSIGTGGLINKNKFVNYFSTLIALLDGNNDSMQHAPLTFKTEINFVSSKGVVGFVIPTNLHDTKVCGHLPHPPTPSTASVKISH